MVKSYKKILEMESIALLKLEQDQKALNKIRKTLYQNKKFITKKLIIYLQRELNINYKEYKIVDIEGNIADILVKDNSKIFKETIEKEEILDFNVEELINNKSFNNQDEILIIDLNSDESQINLGYLCDSLNYHFLSYSNEIKNTLITFVDYVINRNIYNK
ncbi:MAG: hypothetical protein V8R81_08380 [Clostridia bacterium]